MCFFFFSHFGARRALHSFPTRRSSDLDEQWLTRRDVRPGLDEHLDHGARRGRVARRDRKSTRLNSSHVSISYAASCLKKKREAPGAPAPATWRGAERGATRPRESAAPR